MIDGKELVTDFATDFAKDTMKEFFNKTKKFFKDLKAKEAIRYKTAYEEYISNTKQKNCKIKTLIYKSVPKDLYSFYVYINVLYDNKIINTKTVCNLFELGNNIIVTGIAGTGKSLLFKHLFLDSIENTEFIPVLLELRDFNNYQPNNISIYNSIYNSLCDNGFYLSDEYFKFSMNEGYYIIFFDGFDEISEDKKQHLTNEIKKISEKYNKNKYFLSSRPSQEFIGWNNFCETEILKLSKWQVFDMIKKLEINETIKNNFYKTLNDLPYEKHKSFISNPLSINMMLLTFQKYSSVPINISNFYEGAFTALYYLFDETKCSYTRDIKSGLDYCNFKLVFSYICFKSYFSHKFQFSETELRQYIQQAKEKLDLPDFSIDGFQKDLTQLVCMLIKDGLTYHFTHRSFQEYFAACYTCRLLDKDQSELLLTWIKESSSIFRDSYITMLFGLQSEKVNKIIICPILKEIQNLYNDYGFSLKLLENLFSGINISIRKDKNNQILHNVSFHVKNKYLVCGLWLNNTLNGFFHEPYIKNDYELYKKIQKVDPFLSYGDYRKYIPISFDVILNTMSEDEMLSYFSSFQKQIESAMQTIEKYKDHNITKNKTVAVILEKLMI